MVNWFSRKEGESGTMIWLLPLKLAAVPTFPAAPRVGQALPQEPELPFPDASANEVAPEDSPNFQSAARELSGLGTSVSEKFPALAFRLTDSTAGVLAPTPKAL